MPIDYNVYPSTKAAKYPRTKEEFQTILERHGNNGAAAEQDIRRLARENIRRQYKWTGEVFGLGVLFFSVMNAFKFNRLTRGGKQWCTAGLVYGLASLAFTIYPPTPSSVLDSQTPTNALEGNQK